MGASCACNASRTRLATRSVSRRRRGRTPRPSSMSVWCVVVHPLRPTHTICTDHPGRHWAARRTRIGATVSATSAPVSFGGRFQQLQSVGRLLQPPQSTSDVPSTRVLRTTRHGHAWMGTSAVCGPSAISCVSANSSGSGRWLRSCATLTFRCGGVHCGARRERRRARFRLLHFAALFFCPFPPHPSPTDLARGGRCTRDRGTSIPCCSASACSLPTVLPSHAPARG